MSEENPQEDMFSSPCHTYFLTWSNLLQITEVMGLPLLILHYKELLLQPFKVQSLLSLPLPQIMLSPPKNSTGLAKTDIANTSLEGSISFWKYST